MASVGSADWRHIDAWEGPAMGGRLAIQVSVPQAAGADPDGHEAAARRRGTQVARRIHAWAARLTRFDPGSELMRLNAGSGPVARVGPTLAAVLDWALAAEARTGGIVDVTLLDARLAAERGEVGGTARDADAGREPMSGWRLQRTWPLGRDHAVERAVGVGFDLDGVAKGWLADRAVALLADMPGALVDADGDIAIQLAPSDALTLGIADPRDPGSLLAHLHLAPWGGRSTFGVATSGVTVHQWRPDAAMPPTHHLIDPRTRRPAVTDLVQATVLAATAREAEVLAKTAVILGRDEGITFLEAAGAFAAVVLTTSGDCLATPSSLPWLEAA